MPKNRPFLPVLLIFPFLASCQLDAGLVNKLALLSSSTSASLRPTSSVSALVPSPSALPIVPAPTSLPTVAPSPVPTAIPTPLPSVSAPLSNHAHSATPTPSTSSTPTPTPIPTPTPTGERTLDNCATSVSGTVTPFFKDYFRCVTLSTSGTSTKVYTQALPPHKSYYYGQNSPNYAAFDYSRGSTYRPNPNTLQTQNVTLTIPTNPVPKSNLVITAAMIDGQVGGSNDYRMGPVGVALDGVLMFNPLAAPGDDIENEKYTFDSYNSHPEMRGAYHYHTTSQGPLEVLVKLGLIPTATPGQSKIELYGIMCDGTVIMGCTELNGTKPNTADFDAQNGHVHDLVDEKGNVIFAQRYHTHMCASGLDKVRKFTPEIQYYSSCTVQ